MPNSEEIDSIIERIYDLQNTADTKYWKEGFFPNYRLNKIIKYKRPDNSIFFTASIVLILNNIKENLSTKSQKLVQIITEKAVANYDDYQSTTDGNIYNFYPTNPSRHFGNGVIFKHFKHFQLPHDADDTALIYLTKPFSKDENLWLQNKLSKHSNGRSKKIQNTFEEYKNLKAYSTWFGKNMAIEFDAVVLSNILYSQLSANLELDEHGFASWDFIKGIILSNNYITKPFETAHNYAKTSIIAYHIGRLITKFDLPESEKIKEKLGAGLLKIYSDETDFTIDKLLISSTLCRLNIDHNFVYLVNDLAHEIDNYNFFIAGLLSSFENNFARKLSKNPLFLIHWTCPAHTLSLIAENLVLQNLNKKKA
jgi:hypothetical protein